MPRLPAALLVAGALAAAACGGAGDGPDAAASAEPLDFVAPDVRGGQVVGADFADQAVVIWFWAPW